MYDRPFHTHTTASLIDKQRRRDFAVFNSWRLMIPVSIGISIFCLTWLVIILTHGLEAYMEQLDLLLDGQPYEVYVLAGIFSYGVLLISAFWSVCIVAVQFIKYFIRKRRRL